MHKHISEQYDLELDQAKRLLMEMGGLIERQLEGVGLLLGEGDLEAAEGVLRTEEQVNAMEVALDDLCIQIIARRQPAASDLRTLVCIMKASTDLERIGDEAERIAKLGMAAIGLDSELRYGDVRPLHSRVTNMLKSGLDAFARTDVDQAVEVVAMDVAVDDGYAQILQRRLEAMHSEPESLEVSLNAMWMARSFERIGDHVKNVGEYVQYLVKGQDVRHGLN